MADDNIEAAIDAKARRQREQDRNDLWAETAGLNTGRMKRFITDPVDPQTREGKERTRANQATMRNVEAAAQWASEKVIIGGTDMTRADAQAARRRILENPEHYAKLARERGYIKPGEEGALIARIRRMEELEAKRERGETLTDAEEAESRRLQQGEAGSDGKILRDALSEKGLAAGMNAPQADSTTLDRADATQSHSLRSQMAASVTTGLPTMKEILPKAPDVGVAFAAGKSATAPLDAKPPLPGPAGPEMPSTDRQIKATGLDL